MTVLKGPCMSLKARGSLAGTIVYTGNRSTHVVKRQNSKTNPNTIPQRSHRNMLRYLAASWTRLIVPAHASWVGNVPITEYSPFHWYLKWNMERWRRGKAPAWWYGNQDSGATPTMTDWATRNRNGYVRLLWPASGYTNVLGVVWHKGNGIGFPVSPSTAIDVQWWIKIRDSLVTDHAKGSGYHYYRIQLFSNNGVLFLQPDTHSIVLP